MKYNFDILANRKNTNSLKWDLEKDVLPMWVADMDFQTCPEIKQALQKRVDIGAYGYSIIPDDYYEAFIYWWKTRHHFTMEKEYLVYASGIVASISSMVRKLTTVGENVLVQSPTYNIFYNCIFNNGRNIVSNDLVYQNGEYKVDFDDLEKKLSNKQTTLMILCNPHNPVGKIWTKEELAKIGELAYKYHVLVISDEIHCDFTDPGLDYVPFASASEINKQISVTCMSASKTFNVAGLQSACLYIPNEDIRHKVWRGVNTDEVGEPNFFAVDAVIAAYKNGGEYVDEMLQYIYENKMIVKKYLEENLPRLHLVPSKATYLLWVDVSSYTLDSVSLCQFIKQKTGLFVNDGLEYGTNGNHFIRINLATSKANVMDGLNRLNKALTLFEEK